ncbi:MAG: class I SAM-dependent DNA methyltransferase, partial [Rhodospirillales bacterium]|nr:class I SAM-dependent DNA methyltransferase [Rhodospirillales bacterium]
MTPEDFQSKWRNVTATERQASQEHFRDLCHLLDVPNPLEGDPTGADYCFEKTVLKLDGRPGRADVWKRRCFAWEYKSQHKNLTRAYSQLKEYADALENPPLLIVSDMREIRVHTNFTNAVAEQHVFLLGDLNAPEVRQRLRWCFIDPDRWRPTITREAVTATAAGKFGLMADRLMRQGYPRQRVAHFLNKLVFCLFAEDIELLPDRVFADILEEAMKRPDEFALMLADLFRAMRERGGRFGTLSIPWFDGGLFDDDDVLPLGLLETRDLIAAARLDWSRIEPSIFGTLFEQGLDPKRRKEMASLFDPAAAKAGAPREKGVGIHYTDPGTIMKLIEPVVLRPLRREWEVVKARVEVAQAKAEAAKTNAARTRHRNEASDTYLAFRARLGRFRVLDPACGSGNFLYLSLLHLKDFDLAVQSEARALGLPDDDLRIGPHAVLGIEINDYAAELARVTIWIGELQWQLKNGFGIHRQPILAQLPGIECRDA